MYTMIGTDGRQYGPVSAEQLRSWIADHRANGETRVQAPGSTEWVPLSTLPEFADALAAAASIDRPPSLSTPPVAGAPLAEGDYHLDIPGCIGKGWNLLFNQGQFGVLFGGFLVYLVIACVIASFSMIPIIGLVFMLGNMIIGGPLMGGVYYLFLRASRNQSPPLGVLFAGFRDGSTFLHCFLGTLVPGLLATACMLPGVILLIVTVAVGASGDRGDPNVPIVIAAALLLLAGAIPAIYLYVAWMFTVPLVMDQRLDFWPAMVASKRRVDRHWWYVLGLLLLVGLVNVLGVFLCGVGMLFTAPVAFGALMFGYETIFSAREQPAD